MKVIQLHVDYVSAKTSGENSTVRTIANILSVDHEVKTYTLCYNVNRNFLVNFFHGLKMKRRILKENGLIDYVILHNEIPFFGHFFVKRLIKKSVVIKVWHNYRPICIAGTQYRKDKSCVLCEKRRTYNLPGILLRCYRGSFIKSIYVAYEQYKQRNWFIREKKVHHVAVSEFMYNKILSLSIPSQNVHQIYNLVEIDHTVLKNSKTPIDFVMIGRLSSEKGFKEVLTAWEVFIDKYDSKSRLHIVGDGPDLIYLRKAFENEKTIFYGFLQKDKILSILDKCSHGIVWSKWNEPFGKVVLEYLINGVSVISSSKGALPEILSEYNSGHIVESFQADELTELFRLITSQGCNCNVSSIPLPKVFSRIEITNRWNELLIHLKTSN